MGSRSPMGSDNSEGGGAVCHGSEPCKKNSSTDRFAVWVEDSSGPNELCIRWESKSLTGRVNFDGRCAKTAELIEMPFGFWVRMGPRNVLEGGPDPHDNGQFLARKCGPSKV